MSAITQCRTAALGGHVLRCDGCRADQVSCNSCRGRHCPKWQSTATRRWLDARQADLLRVEYDHVVFTLPAPIGDIAYTNRAATYGLLFDVAAEVLQTIAADPKHLGARIGATSTRCQAASAARRPRAGRRPGLTWRRRPSTGDR